MAIVTALERQPISMTERTPLLGYSAAVGQGVPCGVQERCTSITGDTSTSLQPRGDMYLNRSQRTTRNTSDSSHQIKRIYNKREWTLLSRKREHTETDAYRDCHFQPSHSQNVRFNLNHNQYRTEDLRVIETHTRVIPYHEADTEKDKSNCKQIKTFSHKSSDLANETLHMHAHLAEESFRRSQSEAFQGILSIPKVVKSHCNLKCSDRLGIIFCLIGVVMILLGSCFDQMARQLAIATFDFNSNKLVATLKSPNWLEELCTSSNWLVGAEATVTFQPYTMKHEGQSVIFLQSDNSTSIIVRDEGDTGIRLFRDPANYGEFDIFYDNVNAANIMASHIVEGIADDTFGDSFLRNAMISQLMSRVNITDQVIVHKSLKQIIEEFDFPDYNTFFLPGKGYYSPTEDVKQSIKNVVNFFFEFEPNDSLLCADGACVIQNYTNVYPEPFKDFGTFIAASSAYTLPIIQLDMDYDKHTSWMGIITSEYSSYYVDLPLYILDKIPINQTTFPLKVAHPHSNEFYDASSETWLHNNELNSFNSSEVSVTQSHPVVSLQLHNTLGVPITATVNLDLHVSIPDEDNYGILKGQTVPYMKMIFNVSRIPDWLMEAIRIFCAFRLFFFIFVTLASPVCLVIGVVFLCKKGSRTKVSQVECENTYPLLYEKSQANYGSLSKTSMNC